jgi:hypothetical protein
MTSFAIGKPKKSPERSALAKLRYSPNMMKLECLNEESDSYYEPTTFPISHRDAQHKLRYSPMSRGWVIHYGNANLFETQLFFKKGGSPSLGVGGIF